MSNLDGIQFYGNPTLEDIITRNLTSFLSYGLLELGAYYNIQLDQTDRYGNNESVLRPAVIQGVPNRTIYRGVKNDWVWESGITIKSTGGSQPIQASGINVNGIFYATGQSVLGTGYYIDYSRGRVVFDHQLPANSTVKCPHTLRYVQVYEQDSQEYRKINYDWANRTSATGSWYDNELKAYLPCIFVKVKRYDTLKGLELGNRAKVSNVFIEFDVFSENSADDRRLSDILYMLEDKPVLFFDIVNAPYPLTASGTISSNALAWPQLVSGYLLSNSPRFNQDAYVAKIPRTLPIYHSKVTISLNMNIFPN